MLQNLETLSREARSWPFEQARNLLAHVLKKRLSDAERDAAKLLIDAGKADEALATFEALNRPVILETGYGPSGLPHMGTFGEVARTTMVRNAFRALTGDSLGYAPDRLLGRHGRPAQGARGRAQPRDAARRPAPAADQGARPVRHA
jgi:hypothetical protein